MAQTNCKHEWKSSLEGAVCKHCSYLRPDASKCDGYVPRNDNVLIRMINLGRIGSIEMPDVSIQGKQRVVLAIGPQVKDLKVGDIVMAVGSAAMGTLQLENSPDLYVCPEKNVVLVIGSIYDESQST